MQYPPLVLSLLAGYIHELIERIISKKINPNNCFVGRKAVNLSVLSPDSTIEKNKCSYK